MAYRYGRQKKLHTRLLTILIVLIILILCINLKEFIMSLLLEKFQSEVLPKLNTFSEQELREVVNFINFLEREKKKKLYLSNFKKLQNEFQEKLTVQDVIAELEDYRHEK